MKTKVSNLLRQFGIPASLLGYAYLREAIIQSIDNPDLLSSITGKLYPQIAHTFNTLPSRAERAMRHAIEVAWGRGDTNITAKYFGSSIDPQKGKPTVGKFIAAISDALTLEQNSLVSEASTEASVDKGFVVEVYGSGLHEKTISNVKSITSGISGSVLMDYDDVITKIPVDKTIYARLQGDCR